MNDQEFFSSQFSKTVRECLDAGRCSPNQLRALLLDAADPRDRNARATVGAIVAAYELDVATSDADQREEIRRLLMSDYAMAPDAANAAIQLWDRVAPTSEGSSDADPRTSVTPSGASHGMARSKLVPLIATAVATIVVLTLAFTQPWNNDDTSITAAPTSDQSTPTSILTGLLGCGSAAETSVCETVDDGNEFWNDEFPLLSASPYRDMDVKRFNGNETDSTESQRTIETACGAALSSTGSFLCPIDDIAPIDMDMIHEIEQTQSSQTAAASMYVVGHLFGHHILGLLDMGAAALSDDAVLATTAELRADCLAGRLLASVGPEVGPAIGDAIDSVRAYGNTRAVPSSGVSHVVERWSHGSSEQHSSAVNLGFTSSDTAVCLSDGFMNVLAPAIATTSPPVGTVPEVGALMVADAQAAIESAGLVMVIATDTFSNDAPVGAVVAQDPSAGAGIAPGDTVTIVVSKGPDIVVMPSVSGTNVQQAADALAAAGLVVGQVKGDAAGVNVLAEVNGGIVEVGATLLRDTAVDLTFEVPVVVDGTLVLWVRSSFAAAFEDLTWGFIETYPYVAIESMTATTAEFVEMSNSGAFHDVWVAGDGGTDAAPVDDPSTTILMLGAFDPATSNCVAASAFRSFVMSAAGAEILAVYGLRVGPSNENIVGTVDWPCP